MTVRNLENTWTEEQPMPRISSRVQETGVAEERKFPLSVRISALGRGG